MKKKLITCITLCGLLFSLLTGCSSIFAPPTFEEIVTNIEVIDTGKITGNVNVNLGSSLQLANLDEVAEIMNDELSSNGINLTDKNTLYLNIDMNIDSDFDNTNNYTHTKSTGTINMDCSIEAIQSSIEKSLLQNGNTINSEEYSDSTTNYISNDNGETWLVEDNIKEHNNVELSKIDQKELLNSIKNTRIDTSNITKEDGKYILKVSFTMDNNYINNLSNEQKTAWENIFSITNNTTVFSFYDQCGQDMNISIPIDMTFKFAKGTNRKSYVIENINMSTGIDLSGIIDENNVSNYIKSTIGTEISANCDFTLSAKMNLDLTIEHIEDINNSIPENIKNSAIIEEPEKYDTSDNTNNNVDSSIVDTEENNESNKTEYSLIDENTGKDLFRLVNYNYDTKYSSGQVDSSNVIYTFAEPDGWKVDRDYVEDTIGFADTIFFLSNINGDQITLSCSAPSGIVYYYEPDSSSADKDESKSYENVAKNVTTKNNSKYGYDIFKYTKVPEDEDSFYRYIAIMYVDADNSFVLEFPISDEFNNLDTVKDFMNKNF